MKSIDIALRAGLVATLATSGVDHAYLYLDGYRNIPVVGFGFLAQASVFCAIAVLIGLGGPDWLVWLAGALSLGTLGAFALSRTVGLFGFVEQGWEPAPHPALSVAAQVGTGVLSLLWVADRREATGEQRPTAPDHLVGAKDNA
ncbi:hypothetical protein [Mycobacterium shigaense]|uniref:hypothetical protein n=1 Tax=Mycobacterium shigaense TaxID=722731 RepID=UPI002ADF1A0B|nr:hypothetical protein [Mycobacterium shigaense]MEA1124278.1 hypothetical protein [Mycobacterium shigaense]